MITVAVVCIFGLAYLLASNKWREQEDEIYKRARNKKGQLKGDDPSTPNINEAWEGGKKPKRGRGRPKGSKNKPKNV
tara:strand:- start:571 stop:801 length:231 start_codon:yes stop_codon:yes gene_type:complete